MADLQDAHGLERLERAFLFVFCVPDEKHRRSTPVDA
jgi:hypothetical protein